MTWLLRTINWHRRKVAAILTALGMFALVSHLTGLDETTHDVAVITAAVSAGQQIEASDIALLPFPEDLAPADALANLDDIIGRSAAVSLSVDTIIQPGLLVSGVSLSAGRSLVPITVSNTQLRELLMPGTAVALVSDSSGIPGIVTKEAVVHSLPQMTSGSLGATTQSALVLVEVPTELAPEVSLLGQSGQLAVYLTG